MASPSENSFNEALAYNCSLIEDAVLDIRSMVRALAVLGMHDGADRLDQAATTLGFASSNLQGAYGRHLNAEFAASQRATESILKAFVDTSREAAVSNQEES